MYIDGKYDIYMYKLYRNLFWHVQINDIFYNNDSQCTCIVFILQIKKSKTTAKFYKKGRTSAVLILFKKVLNHICYRFLPFTSHD